ncbi:hypothetical protein CNEONATC25_03619 [Clostridium neonatale]|uniref:Uncharacterized protein n=1 Tax=Clostridium neonatale TaxID=137838 RepID=A0A650MWC3_9CLOT|nr:hypothetical protein CNEONATNEC32_03568 [Clostridium neonatale]SUQ53770.1 hypothetical protein CNEONATC25_03619 [Clostridium neonatale]SUQ54486.1 hypothetical protein CNEONATNEC26_03544 [Clostridium neonatale]VCT85988.1 hypothetical protein CNEONATNEC25_03591 [Clostridium neonatale]
MFPSSFTLNKNEFLLSPVGANCNISILSAASDDLKSLNDTLDNLSLSNK